MVDWSKLPDLAAVALLTCAFASVARRGQTSVSTLWLTGWILIAVHFASSMFLGYSGIAGIIAGDLSLASLVDAGVLFMYASVPHREELSSKLMLLSLLGANTLYVCLLNVSPAGDWALTPVAILFGVFPLGISLTNIDTVQSSLRWMVVTLYCLLSAFLLVVQHQPDSGPSLALNGVLFTVYFGCCLHFWLSLRRTTGGALITIAGFFAWSAVFVVGPVLDVFAPSAHVDDEVWNLPKYVVAVGMILLLLEEQLEHNKYLALHDELTGLPNRRLFQDRLAVALERARRNRAKVAVLVIDLDRFKQVNDTLGHHAGDQLLQLVSAIFMGRIRNSDTVARTGGDEFSVILESAADKAGATSVAHSLLRFLNSPLQIQNRTVWVGASIGVALFPDDAEDIESLCIAADLHMYTDKNGARGRSEISEKILPHSTFEGTMQTDFRVTPERSRA